MIYYTRKRGKVKPHVTKNQKETRHETESLQSRTGHVRRHDGRPRILRHLRPCTRRHPQARLRVRDKMIEFIITMLILLLFTSNSK